MNKNEHNRAESAWFAVVRAYQTCARRYEQLLARIDLTPTQLDALLAIRRLSPDSQPKRIAAQLLVTPGNVAGLLSRLQRRGLIRAYPHPEDGRARLVRLTPAGDALIERAQPLARAFIHAQSEPFTAEELESTRVLMTRMERHLNRLDLDAIGPAPGPEPTALPRQAELI
jgi:DNA-binding MarR family transcriptional regulator